MRSEKEWPKVKQMAEKIGYDIRAGIYGASGDRFLSVRELSASKSVSYVTAQKIMTILRERGFIVIYRKRCFVAGGTASGNSPLSRRMKLNHGQPKMIGIHVNNIENPFFMSLVSKTQEYLEQQGYRIIIASSQKFAEKECNILQNFLQLGVAGVISFPGYTDMLANAYGNYPLPYVFVGRKPDKAVGESVLVDNVSAGNQVAKHLIDAGYTNFAYIGLEQISSDADPRLQGYIHGLSEKQIILDGKHILTVNTSDMSRTHARLKSFITHLEKPVGVFCFHDMIAIELITICHQQQIVIPRDIGIAGFDNLPIASQVNPQLTSVAYRFDKMAQTAADLLVDKIYGTKTGVDCFNHYINPVLIIRESSSAKKQTGTH